MTKLVSSHFETVPNIHLYNEYGPTESSVWCIAHKITPKDAEASSVPIGLPIKNIQVYILDDLLQRVPYGTVGDLYIGGLGLTKGYLNDDERTAQSFIQHPFDTDSSKRLYKTGDLAKYTSDGTIEFLGRKDQQVKVRGYRIELDEIEQLIHKNPLVDKAVVLLENEFDTINWEALETGTASQLLSVIKKHIPNTELEALLTSIDTLPEAALDVVIKNLD